MSQSGPPSSPGAGGPPPGARKPDAKKAPLSKREYSLKLNFSMLLTAVIVLLIGVSWVFMLGVMVGRGHNPDDKIHEMTGRVLRGGRQAPAVQEPPQAVLRPEELHFGPSLRDKPLHNGTVGLETPLVRTSARQAGDSAADASAGNAASARAPQTALQLVPQSGLSARFDFVYQVAVFRDDAQADRLRERLEGEGLRTALEKSPAKDGKSLFKVLASRRGTEEDNAQLLAALERLKLGPPLLRSKKAVPSGGGAR